MEIAQRLARGDASMYISMLEGLIDGVVVRDADGEIVLANRVALEQLGFESLEELRESPDASILDRYTLDDEYGRPLSRDDEPGVRALRGEQVEPLVARAVDRKSGQQRWVLLKTSPLHDVDGGLLGEMTVIEDITAVKTAEMRTTVLAESGRVLASSLDYEQTLRNIVEIAVPALADYCSIDVLSRRGVLQRVAAAHRDPERRQLAAELGSLRDVALDPEHPVRRVLSTGTSQLYREVEEEMILAAAHDQHHLELLRKLGARSILIVPLRVPTRAIGVLTLATDVSGRRLDQDDLELGEQLGRRAAVAVDNSRLHTTLREVAETLQRGLLPAPVPDIPGWEIATLFRPTETEMRVDVGGDFYEVIEHEGGWFVVVGDVTGKGVAAASVTAMLRHGARAAARAEPSPAKILDRLDEVLAQQPTRAMATAISLKLVGADVTISSAGHPPAIIVGTGGEVTEAPRAEPMLGAFRVPPRHEEKLAVSPGDLLFTYTDGVVDTRGRTDRFGIERLHRLLAKHAGLSPAAVIDVLATELDAFAAGQIDDDVAVVALRRASD
jgi:PAS domain S-box-containing protein